MLKKNLTIVFILILGIATLIGGYFLVVKTVEIITGPKIAPPKPVVQLSHLKELSDNSIFDYWITEEQATTSTPATTSYYYLTPSGEIYRAEEGADELIASQPIKDLQSITQSKDGSSVLVSFGNKLTPQFSILNIKERSWQPLPLNVRTADFSPDGNKVALLVSTDGKNDLIIQDLVAQAKSGEKLKSTKLLSLYQKGLTLKWLTSDKIILTEKPSQASPSSIWQIDIKTAAIKPLIKETGGLMVQWSKDGTLGIKYEISPKNYPVLSVIDSNGETRSTFDFFALPDKCTLSFEDLFCSAPNTALSIQQIAAFLDSYLKKGMYFSDALYHYRITTSGAYQSTGSISFGGSIDATHLLLQENKLLFINRLDQKLYRLEL